MNKLIETKEDFLKKFGEVPNINTRKDIEEFFLRQVEKAGSEERVEYLKELKAEFLKR